MKHWYIYNKKADYNEIAAKFHISPMLAKILRNRDLITDAQINQFLNGTLKDLYDPYLLDGMHEAVRIIKETVLDHGKIRIIGDYDIDGVCSSFILKKALCSMGADVDVSIPDRLEDGYGISLQMVESASRDGVKLILTCDNGIRAFEQAAKAKELGIKMIITDHHEAEEELPEADAVIDPCRKDSSYPCPYLCGAGVAFKLVQALLGTAFDPLLFDELLMFAGFATVGDVVPLQDENRIFAKEGIIRLRRCINPGMNALIAEKELEKETLDAWHIGFVLGPCINSAGRLKDAGMALRLLEEKDPVEASRLAHELSVLNEERKQLTDHQTILAKRYFEDQLKRNGSIDKVLGVYLQDAHESVAGIIAGRLKEEYYRPVFVVTETAQGLKGSGRSIESYNMIREIAKLPDCFEKYGGHAMACGFTLKRGRYHDFMEQINQICPLTEHDLVQKVWIDLHLPVESVTEEFIEELELLKPFGQSNKKPLFADKDLSVNRYVLMGKKQNALKLYLESRSGRKIDGIMFGSTDYIAAQYDMLKQMEYENEGTAKIACLYYPQINEFRGMRSIQLVITDLDRSR